MAEFVTVDRGIRTCYIILLGELDWEELVRSGGRVIAMTWSDFPNLAWIFTKFEIQQNLPTFDANLQKF